MRNKRVIQVYEHDCVKYDPNFYGIRISEEEYAVLENYHGNGTPYFKLINKGIQFNEYVGALQVGKLTIEVLPKIDRLSANKNDWHLILLQMLKRVGLFNVSVTSFADLKLKSNSILDLYFEIFISEIELLLHRGLIKNYRKKEENITSLKGALNFTKQLQKNIVHQERFFVNHTVYDREHPFNKVLLKTLRLLKNLNTNAMLESRIDNAISNFPDLPDFFVDDSWFDRIVYNRKTEAYQKAIDIAKLLLLHYHPDISSGRNHVLALMFDMNALWERFVYISLKKYLHNANITAQIVKPYYRLDGHHAVRLQPDIHIRIGQTDYIIDTKWKLPASNKPGHTDLQQMYAYTKYFQSSKTILCYPGVKYQIKNGAFSPEQAGSEEMNCSVITIGLEQYGVDVGDWMQGIAERVGEMLQ